VGYFRSSLWDFWIRALPSFNMTSTTASSRPERTEHNTWGAFAGPTLKWVNHPIG